MCVVFLRGEEARRPFFTLRQIRDQLERQRSSSSDLIIGSEGEPRRNDYSLYILCDTRGRRADDADR